MWFTVLKLINNSWADDPIRLHQLGQVHVCWYPMNIPIKTRSISSKTDQDTDQDTDQETWILISLNANYSKFPAWLASRGFKASDPFFSTK